MGFLTGSAKRRGFESPGLEGPGTDEVRTDSGIYGGGNQLVHMDKANPAGVGVGPRSDRAEVDRYRSLGEAAANREAYNPDFSKALDDRMRGQEARGGQKEALAMQRRAAMGGAPSRAAILGGQVAGQSLEGALAGSAGARPGSMAAAQMASRGGMGAAQIGAQGQAMGMRSGEMNAARGAYAAGATGMRAGDYVNMSMSQERAEAQAKAEIAQAHLNQAGQMGYEQMGLNTEQSILDATMRHAGAQNQANQTTRDASDARTARAQRLGMGLVSAVGTLGATGSDSRMKQGATMLSDAHAKREAYLLGRAHEGEQRREGKPVEYAYGGRPKPGEDIVDKDPARANEGATKREPQAFTREHPEADTVARRSQYENGRRAMLTGAALGPVAGPFGPGMVAGGAQVMRNSEPEATTSDERSKRGARGADTMTDALADGLKPYQYEYKPGFAEAEGQSPHEKNVGPMAQDMASNPITGQAVSERPDGMMQIDMKKATKLSLAAAGHNAQKIRELEARMKGGR